MFDEIAERYDRLNRLISFRQDQGWRRQAARAAVRGTTAPRVLDLCCGTGDLALAVARAAPGARVVGADFSLRMLACAAAKAPALRLAAVDALRLPFRAESFDAVTIGFGFRNLADRPAGLAEIRRVLRSGGRLVILEAIPPPKGPLGALFRVYLRRILPRLGRAASGHAAAYRYFADSVGAFPAPDALCAELAAAGFARPTARRIGLGGVALVQGERDACPA
jgi:demethylmenaquinone methyltransferase/2-methoxy-6-polyprenyl-1,4-benzoquinol methylase